jgi:hypothetical protein
LAHRHNSLDECRKAEANLGKIPECPEGLVIEIVFFASKSKFSILLEMRRRKGESGC